MAKKKKLQTILAGHIPEKSKTYFRSYRDGKIEVDFHATGHPHEELGKTRIKSTISVDDCLDKVATPSEAVEALLKHYEANRVCLQVVDKDSKLQVLRQNGDELTLKSLKDLDVLQYYALLPGDNPASDILDNAIEEGDLERVKKAIEAGANLRFLPYRGTPLGRLLMKQKGDWQDCARALVKAGAPINGVSGEDPPLIDGSSSFAFAGDQGTAVLDLVLELGGDLNVSDRWGKTLLHNAARGANPTLVRMLVASGANADALDGTGQLPLGLAKEQLAIYHGHAKEQTKEIVDFLTDVRAGNIDSSELKERIDSELSQVEQEMSAAQKEKEENYWQNLAQIVIDIPETITVKPLREREPPKSLSQLVTQLGEAGFQKIGNFQLIASVAYNLIAYCHEAKNLYGIIITVMGEGFLNLMRFHQNETVCNVSNESISNDFSPRAENPQQLPVRHYVVQQGTLSELLEKMDELPIPASGIETIRPDEFVDRVKEQHALDLAGHKSVAAQILANKPATSAPKRKKVKKRKA